MDQLDERRIVRTRPNDRCRSREAALPPHGDRSRHGHHLALYSVSRRSPPLGQLTLSAIEESVGPATIAGANGGNARFSGPGTLADPVGHSYDSFLAARTHRPDP